MWPLWLKRWHHMSNKNHLTNKVIKQTFWYCKFFCLIFLLDFLCYMVERSFGLFLVLLTKQTDRNLLWKMWPPCLTSVWVVTNKRICVRTKYKRTIHTIPYLSVFKNWNVIKKMKSDKYTVKLINLFVCAWTLLQMPRLYFIKEI